ncbi:TolC family outer membrane protein [Undibacterium terreum]|uniref:Outer membrane protein n=1 Tax=Undibacterium terreum TaxID=1224302 RepID=A0A916UJK6_9BURK|nr:TolC family outer membrane protein [Undibacterium terreum]GGC75344.1 outer membrane protein [Undibacterium terreum]
MKKLPNIPLYVTKTGLCILLSLNLTHASAIDLVTAYQQALQFDPSSLADNEALTAGREKAVQGDALLRPRINLQADVSRIHDRLTSDVPPAVSTLVPSQSTGTARQATVQFVQPLYDLGAKANRQQMREQSALAQFQFDASRQDLVLHVAEAYFGVVVADETLRVVQAEQAALRHQRDRAKARFDIGQGKITDVQEAQARLDGVDARAVSVQSVLELRQTQFRELIGAPPDQLAKLSSSAPRRPEPEDLLTWQTRAEDQSMLVKSRRSELDIAKAEIDKYRLAGRPTVDLVASYGAKGQSGSLSPLVAPSGDRTATVGLQLNIPLYSGGSLDSRQRESIAKRFKAEHDLDAARRDVRIKVQDGFLAMTTGVSRIAALEQALVSARSALEATVLGRDVGTRTQLDVLDAQQRLFTAELDLVQARVDYLLGRLRLAGAAGELSEDSLRALSAWLSS